MGTMELDQLVVIDAVNSFKMKHPYADSKLSYELLSSGKSALNWKAASARLVLEHVLGAALYLLGKLPISMRSGKVARSSKLENLVFFRSSNYDFQSHENSLVKDQDFYRLLRAIENAHAHSKNNPNLEEIINAFGYHPLVVERYGRPISYDDILPIDALLKRYETLDNKPAAHGKIANSLKIGEYFVTGKRALWAGEGGKPVVIGPMQNLEEFQSEKIKTRGNMALVRLRRWLLQDGVSWKEYLNMLGKRPDVVSFHGRELFSGDFTGNYDAKEDREILEKIIKGKLPVQMSDGTSKYLRKKQDLCFLIFYREPEMKFSENLFSEVENETDDQLLPGIFRRTLWRHEKKEGPTPTKLLDKILRSPWVSARYFPLDKGKTVTHEDVYAWAMVRKNVLRMKQAIAETLHYSGGLGALTMLMPRNNPGLYRTVYEQVTARTKLGYYDVLEMAGREPDITKLLRPYLMGRPLTRFDVNPKLISNKAAA